MNLQDIKIKAAIKNRTLHIKEFLHELTYPGWNICDEHGLIEIALSEDDALSIVKKQNVKEIKIYSGISENFRLIQLF